eukprot:TRINITY_DN778_c0_g1_i7.p1 TRINITY_DN778_c0_g1~~TRINITY_DN778_c0_g1_i7.p1  ORF type:complete len:5537 (+),score=943.68 TRINITY_DN778_c0_g1_i7:111-16721(+)
MQRSHLYDIQWKEIVPEIHPDAEQHLHDNGITSPGELALWRNDHLIEFLRTSGFSPTLSNQVYLHHAYIQAFQAPTPQTQLMVAALMTRYQLKSWNEARFSRLPLQLPFADGYIKALYESFQTPAPTSFLLQFVLDFTTMTETQLLLSYFGRHCCQYLYQLSLASFDAIRMMNSSILQQPHYQSRIPAASVQKIISLQNALKLWFEKGFHLDAPPLIFRGYFDPSETLSFTEQDLVLLFPTCHQKLLHMRYPKPGPADLPTKPSFLREDRFPDLVEFGVTAPHHLLKLDANVLAQIGFTLSRLGLEFTQLNAEYQVISKWAILPDTLKHLIATCIRLGIEDPNSPDTFERLLYEHKLLDGDYVQLCLFYEKKSEIKFVLAPEIEQDKIPSIIIHKYGLQNLSRKLPSAQNLSTFLMQMRDSDYLEMSQALPLAEFKRLETLGQQLQYWVRKSLPQHALELVCRGYYSVKEILKLPHECRLKLFPGWTLSSLDPDGPLAPSWVDMIPGIKSETVNALLQHGFDSPGNLVDSSLEEIDTLCKMLAQTDDSASQIMTLFHFSQSWKEEPPQIRHINHMLHHIGCSNPSDIRSLQGDILQNLPLPDGYIAQIYHREESTAPLEVLAPRAYATDPSLHEAFKHAGVMGLATPLEDRGLKNTDLIRSVAPHISHFSHIFTFKSPSKRLQKLSENVISWPQEFPVSDILTTMLRGYYTPEDTKLLTSRQRQALLPRMIGLTSTEGSINSSADRGILAPERPDEIVQERNRTPSDKETPRSPSTHFSPIPSLNGTSDATNQYEDDGSKAARKTPEQQDQKLQYQSAQVETPQQWRHLDINLDAGNRQSPIETKEVGAEHEINSPKHHQERTPDLDSTTTSNPENPHVHYVPDFPNKRPNDISGPGNSGQKDGKEDSGNSSGKGQENTSTTNETDKAQTGMSPKALLIILTFDEKNIYMDRDSLYVRKIGKQVNQSYLLMSKLCQNVWYTFLSVETHEYAYQFSLFYDRQQIPQREEKFNIRPEEAQTIKIHTNISFKHYGKEILPITSQNARSALQDAIQVSRRYFSSYHHHSIIDQGLFTEFFCKSLQEFLDDFIVFQPRTSNKIARATSVVFFALNTSSLHTPALQSYHTEYTNYGYQERIVYAIPTRIFGVYYTFVTKSTYSVSFQVIDKSKDIMKKTIPLPSSQDRDNIIFLHLTPSQGYFYGGDRPDLFYRAEEASQMFKSYIWDQYSNSDPQHQGPFTGNGRLSASDLYFCFRNINMTFKSENQFDQGTIFEFRRSLPVERAPQKLLHAMIFLSGESFSEDALFDTVSECILRCKDDFLYNVHLESDSINSYLLNLLKICKSSIEDRSRWWPVLAYYINHTYMVFSRSVASAKLPKKQEFFIFESDIHFIETAEANHIKAYVHVLSRKNVTEPIDIPRLLSAKMNMRDIAAMLHHERPSKEEECKTFIERMCLVAQSLPAEKACELLLHLQNQLFTDDLVPICIALRFTEDTVRNFIAALSRLVRLFQIRTAVIELLEKQPSLLEFKAFVYCMGFTHLTKEDSSILTDLMKQEMRILLSDNTPERYIIFSWFVAFYENVCPRGSLEVSRLLSEWNRDYNPESLIIAFAGLELEVTGKFISTQVGALCDRIGDCTNVLTRLLKSKRRTPAMISTMAALFEKTTIPSDIPSLVEKAPLLKQILDFVDPYLSQEGYAPFIRIANHIHARRNEMKNAILDKSIKVSEMRIIVSKRDKFDRFLEDRSVSKILDDFREFDTSTRNLFKVLRSALFVRFLESKVVSHASTQLAAVEQNSHAITLSEYLSTDPMPQTRRSWADQLEGLSNSQTFLLVWESYTTQVAEGYEDAQNRFVDQLLEEKDIIDIIIVPTLKHAKEFLDALKDLTLSANFVASLMKKFALKDVETDLKSFEPIRRDLQPQIDALKHSFEVVHTSQKANIIRDVFMVLWCEHGIPGKFEESAFHEPLLALCSLDQKDREFHPVFMIPTTPEERVLFLSRNLSRLKSNIPNFDDVRKNIGYFNQGSLDYSFKIHRTYHGNLAQLFELCFAKIEDQKSVTVLQAFRKVLEAYGPLLDVKKYRSIGDVFKVVSELQISKDVRVAVSKITSEGENLRHMIQDAKDNPVAKAFTIMKELQQNYEFVLFSKTQYVAKSNLTLFAVPKALLSTAEFSMSKRLGASGKKTISEGDRIPIQSKEMRIYKSHEIDQLQSRLRMARSNEESKQNSEQISQFVMLLERVFDLCTVYANLCEHSHPTYFLQGQRIATTSTLEEVSTLLQEYQNDLQMWVGLISFIRDTNTVVNYFRTSHLILMLHQGFPCCEEAVLYEEIDDTSMTVSSIISLYLPELTRQQLSDWYRENRKQIEKGATLDQKVKNLSDTLRSLQRIKIQSQTGATITKIDQLQRGRPNRVDITEEHRTLQAVLTMYCQLAKRFPRPWELLVCNQETTREDLDLFLRRCMLDEANDGDIYTICYPQNMSHQLQIDFCECYERYAQKKEISKFLLVILVPSSDENPIKTHFMKDIRRVKNVDPQLIHQQLQTYMSKRELKVLRCTSERAGDGKTFSVKKHSTQHTDIFGSLGSVQLSRSSGLSSFLSPIKKLLRGGVRAFHFNIGSNLGQETNINLFFLLFLGVIVTKRSIFTLPQNLTMYFEIPNTYDQGKTNDSCSVLELFENLAVIQELDVSLDHPDLVGARSGRSFNKIQYVCHYLQARSQSVGGKSGILTPLTLDQLSEQLSPKVCQDLINSVFAKPRIEQINSIFPKPRIEQINFVRVLYDQLQLFENCYSLNPAIAPEIAPSLRPKVFEWLLSATMDISVSCFDSDNIKSKDKSLATKFSIQSQWKQTQRPVVLFNDDGDEEGSASISVIHFNENTPLDPVMRTSGLKPEVLSKMKQKDYHEMVARLFGLTVRQKEFIETDAIPGENETSPYVFTPDNFGKTMSLYFRLKSGLPIVIVGETGCGKTRLVQVISKLVQIQKTKPKKSDDAAAPLQQNTENMMESLRIHGGTVKGDIKEVVDALCKRARRNPGLQYFLFLDEINTSPLLSVFKEMICDHTFGGNPIEKNISIVAACNPYRRKSTNRQERTKVGLDHHAIASNTNDPFADLVYSVYPLPMSLAQFAWDFGSVYGDDEFQYICSMTPSEELETPEWKNRFVQSLILSQKFIRENCGEKSFVSLRDIERAIRLYVYFSKIDFQKATSIPQKHFTRSNSASLEESPFTFITLSLACNYLMRLETDDMREEYLKVVSKSLFTTGNVLDTTIMNAINRCVEWLELPKDTAKNRALSENLFMMMHALLNRIPLVVVGSPGCSKSYGLHILKYNFTPEYKRSREKLKEMDSMSFTTHQCSPESTSEGILEVYHRASKHRTKTNVPVVVLDEVGLAEQSAKNPLKVLHWLFEDPNTSFLGLSNWSLDAAKMNRAIIVSRPRPSVDDLIETAQGMLGLTSSSKKNKVLVQVSRAFNRIFTEQEKKIGKQYFGLRDFYFIVKSATGGTMTIGSLERSIPRNMGGLRASQFSWVVDCFCQEGIILDKIPKPLDMIIENTQDNKSRHLMVVAPDESGALQYLFECGVLDFKTTSIFYSSDFPDDRAERNVYNSILKVRNSMERGEKLVLVNQKEIYESLYDLFNLHYFKVGEDSYCYLPIGPQADEPFVVHKDFKCIVITPLADAMTNPPNGLPPPFLNRFEKQMLDVGHESTSQEASSLLKAVKAKIKGLLVDDHTDPYKHLPGMNEGSIVSLVLMVEHSFLNSEEEQIVEECYRRLISHASPAGMLLWRNQEASKVYFEDENHDSLPGLRQKYLENYADQIQNRAMMAQILTQSSVLTSQEIVASLESQGLEAKQIFITDVDVLSSSSRLEVQVQEFLRDQSKRVMVLSCDLNSMTQIRLNHTKFICTKHFVDWRSQNENIDKEIYLLCYLPKSASQERKFCFRFDPSWRSVYLDAVRPSHFTLHSVAKGTIGELVKSVADRESRRILQHEYINVLYKLEFSFPVDYMKKIKVMMAALQYEEFSTGLSRRLVSCLEGLSKKKFDGVQLMVAKDDNLINSYGSYRDAVISKIESVISDEVIGLVCMVDRYDNMFIMDVASSQSTEESRATFETLLSLDLFWNTNRDVTGSYTKVVLHRRFRAHFPFSYLIFEYVESLKENANMEKDEEHLREQGRKIQNKVKDVLDFRLDAALERAYISDFVFYQGFFSNICPSLYRELTSQIVEQLLQVFGLTSIFGEVHFMFWITENWIRKLFSNMMLFPKEVVHFILDRLQQLDPNEEHLFECLYNALFESFSTRNLQQNQAQVADLSKSGAHGADAFEGLSLNRPKATVSVISSCLSALSTGLQEHNFELNPEKSSQLNAKIRCNLFASKIYHVGVSHAIDADGLIESATETMMGVFNAEADFLEMEKVCQVIRALYSLPVAAEKEFKDAFLTEVIQTFMFDFSIPAQVQDGQDMILQLITFLFGYSGQVFNAIRESTNTKDFQRNLAIELFRKLGFDVFGYNDEINAGLKQYQEEQKVEHFDLEPMCTYADALEFTRFFKGCDLDAIRPNLTNFENIVSQLDAIAFLKSYLSTRSAEIIGLLRKNELRDQQIAQSVKQLLDSLSPELKKQSLWYFVKCIYASTGLDVAFDYLNNQNMKPLTELLAADMKMTFSSDNTPKPLCVKPVELRQNPEVREISLRIGFALRSLQQGNQMEGIQQLQQGWNNPLMSFDALLLYSVFELKHQVSHAALGKIFSGLQQHLRLKKEWSELFKLLVMAESKAAPYLAVTHESNLDHAFRVSLLASFAIVNKKLPDGSWPFQKMLLKMSEAQNSFLPTMPDDPRVSEILEIVKTKSGAYLCPNGHVYSVAPCTWPMEVLKCHVCNEDIGGRNHVVLSTNVRVFVNGFVDNQYNKPRPEWGRHIYIEDVFDKTPKGYQKTFDFEGKTERDIPVKYYRIMSLFVHMAAFLGSLASDVQIPHVQQPAEKQFWDSFLADWNLLKQLWSMNDQELHQSLLSLLYLIQERFTLTPMAMCQTHTDRNQWEKEFLVLLGRWSESAHQISKIKVEQPSDELNAFEKHINASYDVADANNRDAYLPCLFQPRPKLDFSFVNLSFYKIDGNPTQYQLLHCLFQDYVLIENLRHLPSIISLYTTLYDQLSGTITSDEAKTTTIEQAVRKISSQSQDRDKTEDELMKTLESVIQCWNVVCPYIRETKKARVTLDEISPQTPLKEFIVTVKKDSPNILYLIEHLCMVHNRLLTSAKENVMIEDYTPVELLRRDHMISLNVTDLRSETWGMIQRCSRVTRSIPSDVVEFDWDKLQNILWENALATKSMIQFIGKSPASDPQLGVADENQRENASAEVSTDASLPFFKFSDDLHTLLSWEKVKRKIPQTNIPADDFDSLYNEFNLEAKGNALSVYQEIYLYANYASLTGGKSDTKVYDYATQTLHRKQVNLVFRRITLSQMKSFADSIAEKIDFKEFVPSKYKKELPASDRAVGDYINSLNSEQRKGLIEILEEFIKEYLVESTYSEKGSLERYISAIGDIPNQDRFPQNLELEYSLSFLDRLKKRHATAATRAKR